MKKAAAAAIILAMLMMLYACSAGDQIKTGTYISTEASSHGGNAGVILANEDEFILFVESLSYCPTGKYTVEDGTLTLQAADDEVYVFSAKGGKLIFESGKWLEQMIEKGTAFQPAQE